MRILIDIGHPAHVHLFRNFYHEMKNRNHELLVTVKEIPSAVQLLQFYNIPFISIGSKSDGIIRKGVNQLLYDTRMASIVRSNKIDLGLGSSITLAHVSVISRMKSVIFDDDDDAMQPLMTWFGHPFADYIVSPVSLKGNRRRKDTIFYNGYHELAYLHPNRFIPDEDVLKQAGLLSGETFFIMRFNAFKAHHDSGAQGLTLNQKRELLRFLESRGRIFITGERDLPPEFKKYLLRISPQQIHSLLFYATMFVGDSQTMTTEAAVLGTPALKLNSFAGRLSVPNELEREYNLCYSFLPDNFNGLLKKAEELLRISGLKNEWQSRRVRLLDDKTDLTAFMIQFTEEIYHLAV